MSISIRQAGDRDLELILLLLKQQYEYNRENHSPACKYDEDELVAQAVLEKMRTFFQARDEDILFLIAESNQTPCGYVFARIYEEEQAADDGRGRMGLLEKLFVTEEARGSGLGQILIDAAMQWFESKGMRRVRVHAYSWNERARALYEKNGFLEYAVSFEKFI